MGKAEYDFLTWTSFPSSMKVVNEGEGFFLHTIKRNLQVNPGSELTIQVDGKLRDVVPTMPDMLSGVLIYKDPYEWVGIGVPIGVGSHDWETYERTIKIPDDMTIGTVVLDGVGGSPERPSFSWFDDLKIYQDGLLIYENKFNESLAQTVVKAAPLIIGTILIMRYR